MILEREPAREDRDPHSQPAGVAQRDDAELSRAHGRHVGGARGRHRRLGRDPHRRRDRVLRRRRPQGRRAGDSGGIAPAGRLRRPGRRATSPKPLIAAVTGPALAGGFEMVLACDWSWPRPRATSASPRSSAASLPRRRWADPPAEARPARDGARDGHDRRSVHRQSRPTSSAWSTGSRPTPCSTPRSRWPSGSARTPRSRSGSPSGSREESQR